MWGPPVFIGIYVIAVLFVFPGSVITVLAGVLFGSAARGDHRQPGLDDRRGAGLSDLPAYRPRGRSQAVRPNPRFQALESLAEEHGAVIIAIARLIPLFPFNLLNYGFGLTKVRFSTYVLMSWLFMLPGTVLYVVGSDAVSTLLAGGAFPWWAAACLRRGRRRLSPSSSAKPAKSSGKGGGRVQP